MPTEIIIPKVDMVMETATFLEWLKKEGEQVEKGEPLFVIQTEKASIEIDAPDSGILAGIQAVPEQVLPVATVIGYIMQPGESLPIPSPQAEITLPILTAKHQAVSGDGIPLTNIDRERMREAGKILKVRATPVARIMARQHGIDLTKIMGHGPLNRVHKADILAYLQQRQAVASTTIETTGATQPILWVPFPTARQKQRIPLKGPRLIIAQRMTHSATTIPHIYESLTVDASEVLLLREKLNPPLTQLGVQSVSITALLVYVVGRLLPSHPLLNSSLDGDEIILWEDVHIGIATKLEDYLIVPVVREAQKKTLSDIVSEMASLLEAANKRRLEPTKMTGSTFTISNLGMHGIQTFTPLINPPETAILAVGKIIATPVVSQGEIRIHPVMNLTLGADHRVVDGAQVAEFLVALKNNLENP